MRIYSPVWAHVQDRLGDQDLAEKILYWHSAGVAAEAIARLIAMESGVKPNGETVRRWIRTLKAAA
jgi:hypothetical protein